MYLTEIIVKSVFALLFAAGIIYVIIHDDTNRPKHP
ncbi:hypothetical protein [Providencia phage PSTRCR_128]|nr:hypothetical protein [Providencia phage PSTRCR_128]